MSGDFFDSNIIIYAADPSIPDKAEIAQALLAKALASNTGTISYQVVQETLNVVLHKFANPLSRGQVQEMLALTLLPMWRVMPSATLYQNALDIREGFGFHLYDSLVIAAALQANCKTLYSEDLQHGQRIQTLTVVNPFR